MTRISWLPTTRQPHPENAIEISEYGTMGHLNQCSTYIRSRQGNDPSKFSEFYFFLNSSTYYLSREPFSRGNIYSLMIYIERTVYTVLD